MNRQVARAWDLAQLSVQRSQDERREDRQWDEIWSDAPRGSDEARELVEAAVKLQEAVALVASAHARALARGGPEY